MSPPPAPPDKKKSLKIDPALMRAVRKAQIAAEERGDTTFTISAAVETAITEWLQEHYPEALIPTQGRPRKHPRKP